VANETSDFLEGGTEGRNRNRRDLRGAFAAVISCLVVFLFVVCLVTCCYVKKRRITAQSKNKYEEAAESNPMGLNF
jgi:cell division protein FtsN